MTPRATDVVPERRPSLAGTGAGVGSGWEPAALMGAVLLLLCFGLVNLYSASAFLAQRQSLPDYFYVVRQAGGAAVGLVVLVLCAWIPHTWWKKAAWPVLFVTWVFLLLLVLPWTHEIAPEVNGARRWLRLGVAFQPAEFAKVAVVVWTAALAVKKRDEFASLSRGLLPFLIIWAAIIVPVLLQPDLSTSFVLAALGALVVFTGGGRIGHFLFLGILSAPLLARELGSGFRVERILAFRDLEAHTAGAGYQVHQSLIALGSGGLGGVGFGEGRQKFGFLPEPHNDFIFSMIGEEWGLMGVLLLVGLYLAIVVVGFRIAGRAKDAFGQLLAVGFASLIALQAWLHMMVGLGLVPPTGLSLPLVSYGRSNLVVTLIAVGVLISIGRDTTKPEPLPRRAA